MNDVPTLDIRRRAEWRAWLRENHASSPGVWLVFHKNHTGVESIPYEDSVREALCFGWIDGLIKRLDEERYARKFAPRRPGSRWSDINRRRWAALRKAGTLWPRPAFRLCKGTNSCRTIHLAARIHVYSCSWREWVQAVFSYRCFMHSQ